MLTAATGILIDGPINSINHNVEQIIDSVTCMYEQMRVMACRYEAQFETVFGQVAEILQTVHQVIQRQKAEMQRMAKGLTGDLKKRAEKAQREIQVLISSCVFPGLNNIIRDSN